MLVDISLEVVVASVSIKHVAFCPPVDLNVQCVTDLMVNARGSIDDYDRWARATGDPGWSWDKMFPYFIKV
jgi:hypothetical protein